MTPRSRALCVVPVRSHGDHAGARAELHRLRAVDCAAKTQRNPDATLNWGVLLINRADRRIPPGLFVGSAETVAELDSAIENNKPGSDAGPFGQR
jgi:hypothetical protein